ncbi:hypothetical protein PanWU01x14_168740 [Parasponia andersonii]|uniref:Transmembrane protein n=1 Tax=Parasponia andersonii TaxID=3476 RepID=A0A2P5CAS7_PARAD|nr:hypothetical protein PanWU01x14_168740 [Parasponia andersonii]
MLPSPASTTPPSSLGNPNTSLHLFVDQGTVPIDTDGPTSHTSVSASQSNQAHLIPTTLYLLPCPILLCLALLREFLLRLYLIKTQARSTLPPTLVTLGPSLL